MKSLLFNCKKALSVIVANVMLALTLTATASMDISAVNTSQSYKVYNASNGNYIKSYTLSENPIQDNSRTVIGSEDRVVDFSKSGVVKIVTSIGSTGTGFIVDAHTIATAAHCVMIRNESDLQHSTTVPISHIYVFNSNGGIDVDISTPSQMHVPDIYTSTREDANVYDYALITVSEDLSAYANFNLGAPLDYFINSGKKVYTTGFPGIVNGQVVNDSSKHNMYTCTGNTIYDVANPDIEISYDNDITPGDSGGPLYVAARFEGKIYYTVIGINAKSVVRCNRAVRMTNDLLHFYKNNPNITY